MRLSVPTRQTDVSDILKGIDYIIESLKNTLGVGGGLPVKYACIRNAYTLHALNN